MNGVRRLFACLTAAATIAAASVVAVVAAGPATAAAAPGGFVPVTQHRVLSGSTLTPGRTVVVDAGVPDGATAVVGTISVTSATAGGGITAWKGGTAPGVTNLQFAAGQPATNTAVVALSAGTLTLKDTQTSGSVRVYFDVVGYYAGGTTTSPGVLQAVTPTRVVDTRTGRNTQHGAVGAGRTMIGSPGGHGGIPGSGAGTIAVTITAVSPTTTGSLTAFAPGTPRPASPTLYFAPGRASSVFALVPVSRYSQFDVYANTKGSVQVVVDSVGWFPASAALGTGGYTATPPARALATTTVGAGRTLAVKLAGRNGVPVAAGSTAVLTVIVGARSGSGRITAWPSATPRPGTVSAQWSGGLSTVDQVLVQVGANGYVDLYNATNTVSLTVDVHGYTAPTTIAPPATQTARYLDNLTTDSTASKASMAALGAKDAANGTTYALLDVGAQSYREPDLSPTNPGVAVALTSPTVRLTYAELVDDITAYITAFAAHLPTGGKATVAVGTNNSGNFSDTSDPTNKPYAALRRGEDWLADVISPLGKVSTSVSVVAADDIENGDPNTDGFDNQYSNAKAWEDGYFTTKTTVPLVYNGSANGCGTTFGDLSTCGDGWTIAQFVALTHRGSLISVLPQIYYPTMAVQWANIDLASGHALTFAGTLTEYAVDTTTFAPGGGWAALYRADSAGRAAPSIPRAVDITMSGEKKETAGEGLLRGLRAGLSG